MEVYTRDKDILLKDIDTILLHKDENVNISLVISVLSIIMLGLFLFFPKVYLTNNFYKTSVKIDKLKLEYLSLKDENQILKNKIALIKYKNGVTH